jgi:hypothetical protein
MQLRSFDNILYIMDRGLDLLTNLIFERETTQMLRIYLYVNIV